MIPCLALPGPCSLSGSLDWLACAKWQAACDFWRTGGMVILTTPYAERTAWGMINMIIPCPCASKAKSTLFFGVNAVDLPSTLLGRRGSNLVHATAFFCGVRCSVGVRLSFDSMLTGTAFFFGVAPCDLTCNLLQGRVCRPFAVCSRDTGTL